METATSSLNTLPDGELLSRFVKWRDEAAFAELASRLGPMVRAACRRTLGDTPDADDAFQAAFLILARKAGTLRNVGSLGAWLHTVAVRTSCRVRLLSRRRLARERQAINVLEPVIVDDPEPNDWLPLLDVEIQRLPERLRAPLVMCELQGMNRGAAARQLGIPEGTLSSRLARGRRLLRERLRRSGAIITGACLTTAFLHGSEAMAASMLTETTKTAMTGTASASVIALTEGVLKTMLYAELKIVAIVVLTLGVATGALLSDRFTLAPAKEPEAKKADEANPDKDKLQGKWEIVSAISAGKEADAEEAKRMKMNPVVFNGDNVKFRAEAGYTIDPGKNPKEINLTVKAGPERERGVYKGIYKLSDDELTLCFVGPNMDRPTEFTSKKRGDDPAKEVMLLKLRRVK